MEEALASRVASITPSTDGLKSAADDTVLLWKPKGSTSTLFVSLTTPEKPDVVAFAVPKETPAPANLDELFPPTLDALRATVQTKKNTRITGRALYDNAR